MRLKAVIVRVTQAGRALVIALPFTLLAAGCSDSPSRASCGSGEKFEAGGPAEYVSMGHLSAKYRTVRCHQFGVYLPRVQTRTTAAATDRAILRRLSAGPSVPGYTIEFQAVGTGTTTIKISTPRGPTHLLQVTVSP